MCLNFTIRYVLACSPQIETNGISSSKSWSLILLNDRHFFMPLRHMSHRVQHRHISQLFFNAIGTYFDHATSDFCPFAYLLFFFIFSRFNLDFVSKDIIVQKLILPELENKLDINDLAES